MIARRRFLVLGGVVLLPLPGRVARATPDEVAAAIRAVAGDVPLQKGRVRLTVPMLIDNGNAVSIGVGVDAPAGTRVASLHIFAEGNPLPNVVHAHFGPRSGKPQLATRIRLATSQTVIALAKFADGSCWTDSAETIVTLAACLE